MPKVAMFVWNDFRNDARVLKEAETLQSAGYQVRVYALHTPGETSKFQTLSSGIEVSRTLRTPFWYLRKRTRTPSIANNQTGVISSISRGKLLLMSLARLWTHLTTATKIILFNPHVVHSHDVNTLPTCWLATLLSRARLVYDAHEISTSREGYSSVKKLVSLVESFLMPKAMGTITTTDERAKFFARAYGIPRPVVLQNRPRLQSAERQSDLIRETLKLKEPWPIILYQGGLQQGRGLERLVRVAASVENAYFVFIGGGRLEEPLKAIAASLQLEEKVFFIPTVPLEELLSYTASASIGVQPIENTCLNHFSTDSNKLFEYLIAGLPVVASDLPEIRKVVNQGQVGLLVPEGDSDALAEALQHLVDNSEICEQFRNASGAAAEYFCWEEQESKLNTLYARVLKK